MQIRKEMQLQHLSPKPTQTAAKLPLLLKAEEPLENGD